VDLGDVAWQGRDRAEGDKAEAPKDRGNPLVPPADGCDAGSDLEHPGGDDDERYEGWGSPVRCKLLRSPALVHDAESVEEEN